LFLCRAGETGCEACPALIKKGRANGIMPFHMGMKRTARKVPLSTTTAPWSREEMIDGRSFGKTINQSPTLSICHLFSKIKRDIFFIVFYDGKSMRKAKKAADAAFWYKKCIVIQFLYTCK